MIKTYSLQYTRLSKEKVEAKILVEVLVVDRWARHMAWLYWCIAVFSNLGDKVTKQVINTQKS